MNALDYVAQRQRRVHEALDRHLKHSSVAPQLEHAMRYATFSGGKRLRPLLVYATGESLGIPISKLDSAACAVEFIHTYSLIHDDLPAMDNADLRRSRPTCHQAFDEATAILAGDALQTLAFESLASDPYLAPNIVLKRITTLAHAIGSEGMVGGQMLDMQLQTASSSAPQPDFNQICLLHQLKTGKLIHACIQLSLITSTHHTKEHESALNEFAFNFGLAFQIQDDLNECQGSSKPHTKTVSPHTLNKITHRTVGGIERSKKKLNTLLETLYNVLTKSRINETMPLMHVTRYIFDEISEKSLS